jgi:3-isopropylmalate/(R)-2-methylmalate dehydratase small subunit
MRLRVRKICGVVSTDDILPARYKHTTADPVELARYVFEYYLPSDSPPFAPGDCIVSDSIFGIGSSREQAVSALSAAGVRAIIGPSFGRIFYRNCWNLALPAIEAGLLDCTEGDMIELDLVAGRLRTATTNNTFAPPPQRLLGVLQAGGLLQYAAQRTQRSNNVSTRKGVGS